jgi:hypothetical protein
LLSPKPDWLRDLTTRTGDPFLGLKWQGRDVNHSTPSIAEVQNEWSFTSIPPYAFIALKGTTLNIFLYVNHLG